MFEHIKAQIKPKPTYKANIREQKTTKATIFCAKKTSGREEIGYFAFNCEIVLITSFTILLLKKRPIKVIVLFQT